MNHENCQLAGICETNLSAELEKAHARGLDQGLKKAFASRDKLIRRAEDAHKVAEAARQLYNALAAANGAHFESVKAHWPELPALKEAMEKYFEKA